MLTVFCLARPLRTVHLFGCLRTQDLFLRRMECYSKWYHKWCTCKVSCLSATTLCMCVCVRHCRVFVCVYCMCVWVRAQQSVSRGTWRRPRLRLLALPDVDACSLVYVIVRVPLASGIFVNTICRQAGGLGGAVCGASLLPFRAQSHGRAN